MPDVNLKTEEMKIYTQIKLWSFLVFGLIFLFLGVYFFVNGRSTPGVVKAMIITGAGQLIIFNILFFALNWEKLKKRFRN